MHRERASQAAKKIRSHRRQFFSRAVMSLSTGWIGQSAFPCQTQAAQAASAEEVVRGRLHGLLLGSAIGDALGGPIEFAPRESVKHLLCDARSWPRSRQLSQELLAELGESLVLNGYERLRPEPAAYGPWLPRAAAGTITDDSRHKIVLQRAIRSANRENRKLEQSDVANSLIRFTCRDGLPDTEEIAKLNQEGFQEYRLAARWLLGERNLELARPVPRLWSGVSNCSGQMMFLGFAGAFAGKPEAAYLACYELDFIDAPIARDICAALVAALASLLDPLLLAGDKAGMVKRFEATLRGLDPLGYSDVPYAGRQLTRWLDTAERLVEQADGRPSRLYELLETDGKPVYWWDAHFTLLVPLSILKICDYEPLAAMHLALDFGHDTDSYAQVLGAIIGAMHGVSLFPEPWRRQVAVHLEADYGEDLRTWCDELLSLGGKSQ